MKSDAFLLATLAPTSLLSFACAADELDAHSADQDALIRDVGYSVAVEGVDRPVAILTPVPGVELAFYAWPGSAGVMSALTNGAPDFLHTSELHDLSALEAFWALSSPGSSVPSALVEHQEALARDGEHEPWAGVVQQPQGWGLDLDFPRVHENCVNSTFRANHCLPKSPYTHGVCKIDSNQSWTWSTGATRKYKAGFCLDSGTVNDYLTYNDQAGDCSWFNSLNYIWGAPWTGGSQWNANYYLTWTWTAEPSTASRQWTHTSYNAGGGDRYDWAIMQRPGTICND
jgi:hypothetical protein